MTYLPLSEAVATTAERTLRKVVRPEQ